MKTLTVDQRKFVDGVTRYIKTGAKNESMLPRITTLFGKVTIASRKEKLGYVKSAVALTKVEKTKVQSVVSSILGHEVECHFTVEESILGGLKITVADWVIDTSLESQLATLTQSLL